MQLSQASCPASQLALLLFLISANVICTAIKSLHHVGKVASPKIIRDETIQPTVQPFSTQPITNDLSATNTTIPSPPIYIFHLLDLHAIFTSPRTEQNVVKAMERTCEAFAYYLLDLDLLEEQDLVLRFGDFTLEFHEVAEHLSMLAVKAVVMKLIRMITKGLLGFVTGEMVDAQAGVMMIFAFGVLGGDYENWRFRKRRASDKEMILNGLKKSN